MAIGREDWLNMTVEAPVEPGLPICDSHQHFWKENSSRGQYLLDEFLQDSGGGHKILKTVFVECGSAYRDTGPEELRPVGEIEFTEDLTGKKFSRPYGEISLAAGMVALADLMLGDRVRPVLEAHVAAGKGRVKGIRQSCTWDSNPRIISFAKSRDMMAAPGFRRGFTLLQEYGLSFDAWQYHTQLEDLAELAGSNPGISIIVNHTGGILGTEQYAGKSTEVLNEWRKGVKKLASCRNVFMKLGGLGMPRCGFGWSDMPQPPGSKEIAVKIRPYFEFCIEAFGPARCMFESNYPVDKASYSYTVLWNAFKLMTSQYSASERNLLFYGTAVRAYQLEI
jgi:L-fuconolactonase